jgi:hypothetical protein
MQFCTQVHRQVNACKNSIEELKQTTATELGLCEVRRTDTRLLTLSHRRGAGEQSKANDLEQRLKSLQESIEELGKRTCKEVLPDPALRTLEQEVMEVLVCSCSRQEW